MAYAMYLRKSRIDEEAGLENTLSKHETMLRDMAERIEYEKTERGTGLNPRLRVTLRI